MQLSASVQVSNRKLGPIGSPEIRGAKLVCPVVLSVDR